MNKSISILILFFAFLSSSKSQTKNDTIKNYITKVPVTIDAQANEAIWESAEWHAINQVWMPFGQIMQPGDFEGKFKVAWDDLYLYLLVEVVDDSLSDDHSNPLSNWWDDDCLEIFIDENRSMGNHECTNNAFAYHVSLFYDAIDLSPSCQGINYKDHVTAKMDTIGEDTYLWEMAFKIYDASYNNSNPESSRVSLTSNKLMGITVAYCDNDESQARENFIGSMVMTAGTNNEMYKNANYFGPMRLIDPDAPTNGNIELSHSNEIKAYAFASTLNVDITTSNYQTNPAFIFTIDGKLIEKMTLSSGKNTLDISSLKNGVYILTTEINGVSKSILFINQK